MEIDVEGFGAQAIQQQAKQQHIVKAAAAEAHAVEFTLLADFFGELDEERGESGMEAAADIGDRLLAAKIAEQRLEKRERADLPVRAVGNQIEGIRPIVGGIVGSHFEFDGRLRFVIYCGTNPGEGGNCVEQTAATGCAWGMDLAIDHLLNNVAAAFIDAAKKWKIQTVEVLDVVLDQIAERDAPRFVNRGGAAGHRDVFEMGGALEFFVIGKQHFPAPDCAIRAITGTIESNANHFSIEMIFAHAGSDMGMVVLDTD